MTENQEVIKYVNGNILEHETQGSRKVMLFAVDDSGEFGSGRLFQSLIDRYPEIVDKYESLTDLELGDVHVVYDSPQATVVFLIVLSSEDRSVFLSIKNITVKLSDTIKDSVMEKAVKRSAVIVKDIPSAMVNLPRIGYGTDLPFHRVAELLRKYYLTSNIPCTVFHYRKPANDRKRNAFRARNVSDHSRSPLPAKRRRKELYTFNEYKDEDEGSSSSSDESSEGDYKPSDDDEDLEEMSSSGEDDMSHEEEENEKKVWFPKKKRFAHSFNANQRKERNNSSSTILSDSSPNSKLEVKPESKSLFDYIKSGMVSLNDVPEDLRKQYSDFVMENGGEVVYDEVDLKKATLSIIHTSELLENREKLEKFKEKFEPSCIHVPFHYVNNLKDNQPVPCFNSYIL